MATPGKYSYKGLATRSDRLGAVGDFTEEPNSILQKLFSTFEKVGQSIYPGNEQLFKRQVIKNLSEPVSAANAGIVYGSVTDQLSAYKNFEDNYRLEIKRELRNSTGMSAARRRQLKAALNPESSIDLGLITSKKARARLKSHYSEDVLRVRPMIENFGFPSIYLPSANPNRLTARMVVSTANIGEDVGYQPILDLLQQSTFSIDPFSEGRVEDAITASASNLPSTRQLQARLARATADRTGGGHVSVRHIPVGSKLFFADIETTGVTDLDIARSISVGSGTVVESGGVKTISMSPDIELGARFGTAQMSQYTAAHPYLKTVTTLSEAVIAKETTNVYGKSGKFGIDPANIFDLTTESGRAKGKAYYENLFAQLSGDDSYFVAYNGQFDVKGMIKSARSLDVDEGILTRFEERMVNGGLVDVLGLTREKLNNRLAERMAKPLTDANARAIEGLRSLLSDAALNKARVAGEAVKPFSLENVLQSTNLLELLGAEADAGGAEAIDLLKTLSTSQASHIDITDRKVAQKVLQYMDQLDFVEGSPVPNFANKEIMQQIAAARINVASSRAIIGTTNLADPRLLTEAAYAYVMGEQGIKNVELELPRAVIQRDLPGVGASVESATLKFDPNSGAFRLFTPGGDPLSPVSIETPSSFSAENYIRQAIQRNMALAAEADLPMDQATIASLGVSPIQASNMHSMNAMMMDMRSGGVASSITANQDALVEALGATRQHIGFNYMQDTGILGGSIINRMRGPHDPISDASRKAYRETLQKAGIGSASMNPELRSTFVALSTITSPLAAENTSMIRQALSPLVESETDLAKRESQLAARTLVFQDQLKRNAGYLSELEGITVRSQKIISGTGSVPLMPVSILQKAKTLDESGKVVSFFSEEALQSRTNRVRISPVSAVTEVSEARTNFIYGGFGTRSLSPQELTRVTLEAESIYDEAQRAIEAAFAVPKKPGDDENALVRASLARTKDDATSAYSRFGKARDTVEGAKAFEEFKRQYIERGVGFASLEGEYASKINSVIEGFAGTTQTDTIAAQLGLELNIGQIDEEMGTLTPRLSDEAIVVAKSVGGQQGVDLATRSSGPGRVAAIAEVYRATEQDSTLFKKIRDRFTQSKINFGVGGTDFLAERGMRDDKLFQKMAKLKPTIYTGVAAVAALSAGYYIGKRQQENQLYDEVMEPQSTETNIGPMAVSEFNRIDQQMARQSSSRRDPLVTAGVVGNLDRNKISHTKMGSNKHNHLFGA